MTFGECECGMKLLPVWFTEFERDRYGVRTGRKRKACSQLVCECCGRRYVVDDTFDEDWR